MALNTEIIKHNAFHSNPKFFNDFVDLDGRLSFFIDSNGVTNTLFGEPLQALKMSQELNNRIIENVKFLDTVIEPDFSFVTSPNVADITIAMHDTGTIDTLEWMGRADLANFINWDWDINKNYVNKMIFRKGQISLEKVYNDNIDTIDPNFLLHSQSTIAHELGHALGLEHIDDNFDGDIYQGPEISRQDTIMYPGADKSPFWYLPIDIQALQEIWGPETGNISPTEPKQFTTAWLSWASKLWESSEKDGIIEYFVDKKGSLNKAENTKFSKSSKKFINQLMADAESATGLSFKKSKDPDSIISFESKQDKKDVDVNKTKNGFEIEIDNMSGQIDDAAKSRTTKYLGYVLGLDDMKGKYLNTTDSTMSPNLNQYDSFTQSDRNTLGQVWDHLANT